MAKKAKKAAKKAQEGEEAKLLPGRSKRGRSLRPLFLYRSHRRRYGSSLPIQATPSHTRTLRIMSHCFILSTTSMPVTTWPKTV